MEQQLPQQEDEYFPIQERRENEQTTRWKVEPEDVIRDIAHMLNGDVYDGYNDMWIINTEKANMLCNEFGNRTFITYLRSFLNKNLILSNIDNEMINKIALKAADNTADLIYTSYDTFDINKVNAAIIHSMIDDNVYATLRRAKDGFFTDHLSTTQRYIEQSNVTTEQRQKSKGKLPSVFGNWGTKEE
tara:strand:+ start:295 stop:858 length:564 start_codon:yes stop_codon:yes gene_type:complete